MPSGKPKVPEEGFRHQVYGFNTDDVLAYINALANEGQQQRQAAEEQNRQLQAQIDKLKKEQQNARACVEKLQSELMQQTSRADQAEQNLAETQKQLEECQSQLTVSESRANGYQGRYQQSQCTMLEWKNKCQELQQQLEDARKAAAAAAIGGGQQPELTDLPAAPDDPPAEQEFPLADPPAETAEPEELPRPQPQPSEPDSQTPAPDAPVSLPEDSLPTDEPHPAELRQPLSVGSATVQARKMLADAKIYVESAVRRMQQQAEEQKSRMAENARDLAAGVQVLRDRLSRVDEKLSAAALDLENATAAIYLALDHTDADLQALGVRLDDFANGTPESDDPMPPVPPQPPQPAQPADPRPAPPVPPVPPAPLSQPPVPPQPPQTPPAPRQAVTARRVRPVAKPRPVHPATPPTRRLRNVRDADRRAVTQTLVDAINRVDGQDQ